MGIHNRKMTASLLRRAASVIFALVFMAGAQAHAMPMMSMLIAGDGMTGIMHGSPIGDCKGCSQDGTSMKAGCMAVCAALSAIAPQPLIVRAVVSDAAWFRANDPRTSHATAPDTSPPRS